MTSAVQGAVLDMAIPDGGVLVGNPALKEFGLLNLPLLVRNTKEADAVLDGAWGKKLLARMPETGVTGLVLGRTAFGMSRTAVGP
jgi:TRAP-type C4-dicarboxylate transport system substrate-binding protein